MIFFPVLLFAGSVSSDTAPQPHPDSPAIPASNAQLLNTIAALEQQAAKEAEMIAALNDRIARLEQKIAALNSAVMKQHELIQTIQIEDGPVNQGSAAKIDTAESSQSAAGSAAISPYQEKTSSFFDIEFWRAFISPFTPYLIPASAGILVALILLLSLRVITTKRGRKTVSGDEEVPVSTSSAAASRQNPIATNEKNAMLAQKLAALRSAVDQGKQRRQKQE
ncbi:TMF family protein [Nitrosomonas sp. Nm51]|uniref:TMF family protein n=1 Tax=Nitrosomonas sp. Nm51 TaxID=133720 RepID=UPI00115FAF89|nr:TMF family protein [Nitrosomonas sp. Nm51]